MKVSVKNLKGEVFQVEANPSDQVLALKAVIETARKDLPADRQKLIHAGKVLRDDQTIDELKLKEGDFIVCMATKEVAKKPTPTPTTPAPTAAAPVAPPAPKAPPAAPTAVTPVPQAVAPATPAAAQPQTPQASEQSFVTAESLASLQNLGFPEAECRAALQAAMGNPNMAYEFLVTGIPEQLPMRAARTAQASTPPAAVSTSTTATSGSSLEQLRQHPQFNQLKQLVQSNPAAIPQVLDLISQQSPALYAAIQENNDAFLAMMNEPITAAPTPAAPAAPAAPTPGTPMTVNMSNPAQVMQLMAMLPPEQRAQFADSMGMSAQEMEAILGAMRSMPPEQLQQVLAMGGAGIGGMGGGPRGGPGGPQVVRLTEDEAAAVNRLAELGFSWQQAAEAYLACDKNEELAANLLLGGGFEDDMQDFGDMDQGDHDDHDDDDHMYS